MAAHTREAILFVEAAGFDVVIVETVGVGQSETDVANMTDVFVLLQLPNAGDDLQAIKRGIVELADIIVYNKRDLDPDAAQRAMAQMTGALTLLRPAVRATGSRRCWASARCAATASPSSGTRCCAAATCTPPPASSRPSAGGRRSAWTWHLIDAGLRERFRGDRAVRDALPDVLEQVAAGTLTPTAAAAMLLESTQGRYAPCTTSSGSSTTSARARAWAAARSASRRSTPRAS